MAQRSFVFRVDASTDIGTGHVMRCLTLADALRDAGARCEFACKEQPGNLLNAIREHGFVIHPLQISQASYQTPSSHSNVPTHSHWLGGSSQDDAAQTLRSIRGESVDWLVVDHYALGREWESELRNACKAVMVLDDLADRRHDCDVILDQNLGRNVSDYGTLVPKNCKILTGPSYALLRPEFAALRSTSLARRPSGVVRQVLVTMGGMDKDNATGKVLGALEKVNLPSGCKIIVVLGNSAPWLSAVRRQAELASVHIEVRVAIANMAELMSESDFAIGAAGSTSWERCCMGLPSMVVILAENQREIAENLKRFGVARVLDIDGGDERLSRVISECISDPEFLTETGLKGARFVDGEGTRKIVDYLLRAGW